MEALHHQDKKLKNKTLILKPNNTRKAAKPYLKHIKNTNMFFSPFLAPLNAVTLGAQPNNL